MKILQPLLTVLLSGVFLLASCSSYQTNKTSTGPAPTADPSKTLEVDLCELQQSPEKYERQPVRVKGYLCDCFENGTLYAENCPAQKKIWLVGSFNKCKNAARVDGFRSASKNPGEHTFGGWTFGAILIGRLTGIKGDYGHMGQYDLLFEIECLEHAEMLDRNGRRPSEMPKEQQQKVQEFERLK